MNLERARRVFLAAMGMVVLIAFVLSISQGLHAAVAVGISPHPAGTSLAGASFWAAFFETFATTIFIGALISTGVTMLDGILHWWREPNT